MKTLWKKFSGKFRTNLTKTRKVDAKPLTENVFEVCGKMRMDEFCEFFNVALNDEDVTTIGGYFVKKLGKIAQANDQIQDEYFSYCVTETESSRIVKLRVERFN